MSKFFSYDPEGNGFELHETAEEAKATCQDSIDETLSECECDGVPDWLDEICWGELKQYCKEYKKEKFNDYGDYYADYILTDIEPKG